MNRHPHSEPHHTSAPPLRWFTLLHRRRGLPTDVPLGSGKPA
jgi:hypothetical protein